MGPADDMNPLGRFSTLVTDYARYRPGYPPQAIDFLVEHLGLTPESTLADVGCGTGISTRLFAARGIPVIGIEPNDAMRAAAEQEAPPQGLPPVYRPGQAEATGLADGSVDAVLAAQAFHWFQPADALREFHRVLKPGGRIALLWYERDESDPCTRAFGDLLRTFPRLAEEEARRQAAGLALGQTGLFGDLQQVCFSNQQTFDEEGLIGRAFSVSYLPRDEESRQALARELRRIFGEFARQGQVTLCYQTPIQTARRSDVTGPGSTPGRR